MSAAPTITGARPIPSLRTKTAPLRRSSNAKLRCGELADGVGPIRSLIRRSGPVGPGPVDRASLAAAVSAAARRRAPQPCSSDRAGENALLDDGVNAPVSVDNLRDTEINRYRHQRDCLVFGQALGVPQERSHFAECILERKIDR